MVEGIDVSCGSARLAASALEKAGAKNYLQRNSRAFAQLSAR